MCRKLTQACLVLVALGLIVLGVGSNFGYPRFSYAGEVTPFSITTAENLFRSNEALEGATTSMGASYVQYIIEVDPIADSDEYCEYGLVNLAELAYCFEEDYSLTNPCSYDEVQWLSVGFCDTGGLSYKFYGDAYPGGNLFYLIGGFQDIGGPTPISYSVEVYLGWIFQLLIFGLAAVFVGVAFCIRKKDDDDFGGERGSSSRGRNNSSDEEEDYDNAYDDASYDEETVEVKDYYADPRGRRATTGGSGSRRSGGSVKSHDTRRSAGSGRNSHGSRKSAGSGRNSRY